MTRKWCATLCHPKMYPHTKFGIPFSKNIGDMDRTRKRDGHTDGRTVRLLYASQSSFGGIKRNSRGNIQSVSAVKLLYSIFMSIDTRMTIPNSHLFHVAFN